MSTNAHSNAPFQPNFYSGVPINYNTKHIDEIREIVVYQEGVTPEVIYKTSLDRFRGKYLYLICRGDYPHNDRSGYANTYEATRKGVTHTRIPLNPEKALRHILGVGEQHRIDEDELIGELSDQNWFDSAFSKIIREDSTTRLKNGIKQLIELTVGKDRDYLNRILTNGNRRDISHRLAPEYNKVDAKSCYRVAYELAQEHEELAYVEGFGINKYGSMPRFHAWNELNGKVLDYTWEWTGPVPDEDAVYYGVKIDKEEMRDAHHRRGYCARVLMSDNNVAKTRRGGKL